MSILNFFKKKKQLDSNAENKKIVYNYTIKYNVSPPTKVYDISVEEKQFIEELFARSSLNNLKPSKFSFTRLSNGTINVEYDFLNKGGFVGKVKLQGKKKFITYMKNMYDSETIDGELSECINVIELWIKYINKYFK